MLSNLQGWRTIIVGLGMTILPGALQYAAGVDWSSVIGPTGAMAVAGALTIIMRLISSTPVGTKA
jgi:hypothetical protein